MRLSVCFVFLFILLGKQAHAQIKLSQKEWVDSVFETMSPEQRLGQLFMVAAYSNKTEAQYAKIDSLIVNYNLGGLIFFQGGPLRQARLTNRYQSLARIPLWIGMDAEWGLGMRLDSTLSFPKQMTLGAIQDNELIYKMGIEIGEQCRRMGVHVNFAPVVDINTNPENPVIGNRSFGENKENVAAKGVAYMSGLQERRVLACAKHFPGHGDTDTDSHLSLPLLKHDKKRLDAVELYPFKKLIKDSVGGVMVAHLQVPAHEDESNTPASISREIVTEILKGKMNFKGLAFTDALNMKAVSKLYGPGELDLKALQAGNDVLLFSEDVPKAITLISEAAKKKKSLQKEIDKHVRKVLMAKYWLRLTSKQLVKLDSLYEDLNTPKAQALRTKLYESSFTLIRNKGGFLPIYKNQDNTFASVTIGLEKDNVVQKTLSKYARFTHFSVSKKEVPDVKYAKLLDSLSSFNVVVISLHELTTVRSKNFGLTQNTLDFIAKLSAKTKVVVAVLGSPYALGNFPNTSYLICGYDDNFTTRRILPQVIFGALGMNAHLPVTASEQLKEGDGLLSNGGSALKYSIPESVGMSTTKLGKIDSIALQAIKDKATPGCQILIARKGTVVYNKTFGCQTYSGKDSVTENTVYDLASITKVAATTLAVMYLYENGQLSLDSSISVYLPELKGTNKENLNVQEVLSHQAGLISFLEHWKRTLNPKTPNDFIYCNEKYGRFCIPVTNGMYADQALPDSVWKWTIKSDLLAKKEGQECYPYVYSDIGFYIMKAICERILNQPIDQFLDRYVYGPLDFRYLGFHPTERIPLEDIAPTELDTYFRHADIRGTVHDQGAAMLGGVSGHAGLFSNAHDIAILMQMLLNGGEFNNQRFFRKETLEEFTRAHYYFSRRGLGWDKPSVEKGGPTSPHSSKATFGHSGFTGTCVWMDPESQLLYVFLSNRTYPTAENKKLINQNIRTRIHDAAYEAILPLDIDDFL
jgi:beta-glucosidase-like glycosyl hydrolase/CubicO group peptidase (beta-lactamase class C family)